MAYEQRDNSGTLGRNDRKEKDSHPDHKGQCIIDGKAYWISAWIKESVNGKFFSLAFQPKEEQQRTTGSVGKPLSTDFVDDDIPF